MRRNDRIGLLWCAALGRATALAASCNDKVGSIADVAISADVEVAPCAP